MTENHCCEDSNCLKKHKFTISNKFMNHNGSIITFDVIAKDGNTISIYKVCDLLNGLHKENKELKKRISDLQKENYGNIDGIAFYQEENASLCEKISDLECENEKLKEKVK